MNDVLFTTSDYRGYQVTLKAKTFYEHIVAPGAHEEMRGNVGAIKETVENPEVVYESATNPCRDIYFCRVQGSTFPNLYTKVVVEFKVEKRGTIKSSWFEKEITGVLETGLKYVRPKK